VPATVTAVVAFTLEIEFMVVASVHSISCVTVAAVDEFLACDGFPSTLKSAVNIPGPLYLIVGCDRVLVTVP